MQRRRQVTIASALLFPAIALTLLLVECQAAPTKLTKAKGTPSYVLPLASPLSDPRLTYIPPWSFGNTPWDPVHGAPAHSGPSPDYRNSLVPLGATAPFPPGTIPEQNPNMYIQRPPTGVNNAVNAESLARFRSADSRLNDKGTSVGDSTAAQLALNEFPSEFPFSTNSPYQDTNAGLPLWANAPEKAAPRRQGAGGVPNMLETASTVTESARTDAHDSVAAATSASAVRPCVRCEYIH